MTIIVNGSGLITGESLAPGFKVYQAVTVNGLPDAVETLMSYDTVLFDKTAAFTLGTGRFNPKVQGYYQMNWRTMLNSPAAAITNGATTLQKNSAPYSVGSQLVIGAAAAASFFGSNGADVVFMNGTTDYLSVSFYCDVSSGTVSIFGAVATFFSGHLIGT